MHQTVSLPCGKSRNVGNDNLSLLLSFAIAFASLFALSASAQDGSLDATFNPTDQGYSFGDGVDGEVYAAVTQPDGRVIIGGIFSLCHGQQRGNIARLNTDGTVDNTFFSANGYAAGPVRAVALQADGRILVGGSFTSYQGNSLHGLARLNSDGTRDESFNMGTGLDNSVSAIALQPDGKILIAGSFSNYNGTPRKRIARLLSTGALDPGFDPGTGPDQFVNALALQSDGKIIAGGDFTVWSGAQHKRLVRLNSNGTVEATYNAGIGLDGTVNCLALQSDGKVLLGGAFTTYNGSAGNHLARLTTAGALDASFAPGTGPSLQVRTIVVLGTGKLLVGGDYGNYNGTNRQNIARVNADGTLDATFDPGTGAYTRVSAIAVQADGKAVLGGLFPVYNGTGRGNIARVNANGTLDAQYATNTGANGNVLDTKVLPDGKILIVGQFTLYNGTGRNHIARLNADGSLDATFDPGFGANAMIWSIAVQPDGKLIIGGEFQSYNGTVRNRVARLNAGGTLDMSFDPGAGPDSDVYKVLLQPDGKVLAGGLFVNVAGAPHRGLVRLTATGAVDNTFVTGTGVDGWVQSIALQPDGKVLAGGMFTHFNNVLRSYLVRLNADGSLDDPFNVGIDAFLRGVSIQPDGKILVTGNFTLVSGFARSRIARLNADGSVDGGFDAGIINYLVLGSVPLADGRILIHGGFSTVQGKVTGQLARLYADGTLDTGFKLAALSNYVYALAVQSDGRMVIGGQFTSYGNTGRNRIARVQTYGTVGVKVLLGGPWNGTSMNDGLRALPDFPLDPPFNGLSSAWSIPITPGVLTRTGNNAIVDWVLVELRPAGALSTVTTKRPALLQRDGDVVGLDGLSPLTFNNAAGGSYCLSVRPRNHLPVMLAAASPIAYGTSSASVDFTLNGTAVHDQDARLSVGGLMALAPGDVNGDGVIKYTGAGNDRDPVLTRIGGTTPNSSVSGYYAEDVNMDGVVKYTGSGNDRDPILTTIGGTVPTNTRNAQLP